jgi:AGCS family alanine or glycine:cation symporter
MHDFINAFNYILWSHVLIVVLSLAGIIFTIRTKFVQLRHLPEMFRLLAEGAGGSPKGKGISTFQAFCVSTASRVGVGNIAGVAIAIVTGGPGAVFWMWFIAFLGCATGFVESTLAQIYKVPKADGSFHGGPAYYIHNVLKKPRIAKFFAILISITFSLVYNSVQANTISIAMESSFGVSRFVTGIALCILTGLIIFGGMTRIAKVAEVMVPMMAVFYVFTALLVTVFNIDKVPGMLAMIFREAISPQAAVGGGIGTVILTGFKRGLFSNEAGEGSIPNAAATATANHPVKQGLIQSLGVYIDTWLVCSATAFIILLSEQYVVGGELTGIALAQQSLAYNFGGMAPLALTCIVFLFAFSSVVGNYFYGEINISFFKGNTNKYLFIFRSLVLGMVFFGSVAELALVWDMADMFMGMLCLTNIYAIVQLAKHAYVALDDYTTKRQSGLKNPAFTAHVITDKTGIHTWGIEKAS